MKKLGSIFQNVFDSILFILKKCVKLHLIVTPGIITFGIITFGIIKFVVYPYDVNQILSTLSLIKRLQLINFLLSEFFHNGVPMTPNKKITNCSAATYHFFLYTGFF